MAITFDGYCSRNSGSLANLDVKYQGLFYNGSSTTWSTVIRTVDAFGYWNITLGDGDWLTQDGNAGSGDKVIIVFWRTGIDRNATCPTLDEWGAFEITLDGSSTYTNPTQVKVNIDPNLIWTFPTITGTNYVNWNYSSTNSSDDVHSWSWSGTTMYHWYTRYGETINNVNQVNNSSYYWGDGDSDLTLSGTEIGTHQWSSAGIYDVDLIIEDECGGTTSGTKQVKIYLRPPSFPYFGCGMTMIPSSPDPNEPVSFQWPGIDENSTITSIDWVIYDTGFYGTTNTTISGQPKDAIVPHTAGQGTDWCGTSASGGAFTNPGLHNVVIVIHWFDGFDNQILNCDQLFWQGLFTGPTVDFTQDPLQATISGTVEFTNTSTDTSRVGTGLPDCSEYTWTWTDDGVSTTYSGKPYSYKLSQVPGSVDCEVKLCADWSDGWDTHTTCVSGAVVFDVVVTVTEVDCYYNFNVTGTSSDGTVDGYSWEIYKTTVSGGGAPWELYWSSPQGMDQNDKKGCFTSEGYYRIQGYIYGTGTTASGYEDIYVSTVCCEESLTSVYVIWNGTGVDDTGGDWLHSGYGTESSIAKHSGTNGLNAAGLDNGDQIKFTTTVSVDLNNFGLLTLWVKANSWTVDEQLKITFDDFTNYVNLANYINIYSTDWQQAFIPLEDLGVATSTVSELILEATGRMDLYLDDITLSVGELVYRYLPVCDPEMTAHEEGVMHVDADHYRPSARADSEDETPSMRSTAEELEPDVSAADLRPSLRAFPEP